jgi:hypothetical protein
LIKFSNFMINVQKFQVYFSEFTISYNMKLKGVIKSNFFNNLPKKLSTKEGVKGATRNYLLTSYKAGILHRAE